MAALFEKVHLNTSAFSVRLSSTGSGLMIVLVKSTNARTVASTCFSNIPEDILLTIAELWDGYDLRVFCLASKGTMEASIGRIYRHVDVARIFKVLLFMDDIDREGNSS